MLQRKKFLPKYNKNKKEEQLQEDSGQVHHVWARKLLVIKQEELNVQPTMKSIIYKMNTNSPGFFPPYV